MHCIKVCTSYLHHVINQLYLNLKIYIYVEKDSLIHSYGPQSEQKDFGLVHFVDFIKSFQLF